MRLIRGCDLYPSIYGISNTEESDKMIAFANYNTPSIDIIKNFYILPLYKLVVDRIGIIMYKYANDLLPPALYYLYTSNSDVHNNTTRQRHLLHVNNII